MNNKILTAALDYTALGLSVIPVFAADYPDESKRKRPTQKWKQYQNRIATEQELKHFFKNGADLAVVTGSVSGNLEILDFDEPDLFQPFMELLAGNRPELAKKVVISQTPSGGFHLIYRCQEPVEGNQKLARSKDGNTTLIETRGEGGYFLISPSAGYKLENSIDTIRPITKKERDFLLWLAMTFDEYREPKKKYQSSNPIQGDSRPGDIFNRLANWHQLLEEDGWTFCKTIGDHEHWTRPGKKDGITSATLHPEKGLYVFSTSTQLPAEAPLGKFAYITYTRFDGDFRDAARWVVTQYPDEFKTTLRGDSGDSGYSGYSGDNGDNGDTRRQTGDSSGDTGYCNNSMNPNTPRNYSAEIRSFLHNYKGSFRNSDIDNEFNYRNRVEKQGRSKILNRLENEGKIKRLPSSPDGWRTLNTDVKPMQRSGERIKPFSLPFPLKIGELTNIFPGNVITLAGETGAGKTGFCLKTVANILATTLIKHVRINNKEVATPNGSNHLSFLLENGIHYFNSEMGEAEITEWEQSLGINLLDDPHLSIYPDVRYGWEDLINPNGINIIDYVEVYENFYNVGQIISDIEATLDKGIAIVCIQKSPGKELGLGGQFSAWKARLVITLSLAKAKVRVAKLQKIKAPADRRNNHEGMEIDYLVTPSGDFHTLSKWKYVNEKERVKINQDYQKNPPLMPYRKVEEEVFGEIL